MKNKGSGASSVHVGRTDAADIPTTVARRDEIARGPATAAWIDAADKKNSYVTVKCGKTCGVDVPLLHARACPWAGIRVPRTWKESSLARLNRFAAAKLRFTKPLLHSRGCRRTGRLPPSPRGLTLNGDIAKK